MSREGPRRLLGVVQRNDIVRAYDVGVVRREEARRRAATASMIRDSQVNFLDIPNTAASTIVGKRVADLKLPPCTQATSSRHYASIHLPLTFETLLRDWLSCSSVFWSTILI